MKRQVAQPLPKDVRPMLATLIAEPFDDPNWLFETKWDGYRALMTIERGGALRLISRNGNDFMLKFPELAELGEAFTEHPLIVDGEIVVLDAQGISSFQALQGILDRYGRRHTASEGKLRFVVFDVLYGGGRDVRDEPLDDRKTLLRSLLSGKGPIVYSTHVIGKGKAAFASAQAKGLEGIVGKRRDAPYVGRRSGDWVKIKTHHRQECVIGGWTEGRGSREHFGALLAGVYEGEQFVYVGSVGTGFDRELLASLSEKMRPLERKTPAFAQAPQTPEPVHWVTPALVAEVRFAEWTRDGRMRQPVFVALRADKAARDVVRERER